MSIKSRFTTTDVKAIVRDLKVSVVGQRIANVYDINDKTYLFKFAVPGATEKLFLLMESGIRFHTTSFQRDKSDMPSPFAMKLRRYLRTKRLEEIRQLGGDRVVDFRFGTGDSTSHIILELYANGNIILTDQNYEILALLRSHQFDEEAAIKVGEIYPVAMSVNVAESGKSVVAMTPSEFLSWVETEEKTASEEFAKVIAAQGKKDKMKKLTLRQHLLNKDSGVASYGVEVLDDCITSAGLSASAKLTELQKPELHSKIELLLTKLSNAKDLISLLNTPGQPGYVLYNGINQENAEYVDFTPRLFHQHESKSYIEFPSFNSAVDDYFCKIEEQKLQRQINQAEEAARKKIDKIKTEQENMIRNLEATQERMEMGAALVETFSDDIDKVFLVLNSALANGMSWEDIDAMVRTESAAGNPIASLISKLKLDKNRVVLKLRNLFYTPESDSDSDSEVQNRSNSTSIHKEPFLEIEVDITMSAYGNARSMFVNKKNARTKEERTIQASIRVLENVEEQTMKQLESQQLKKRLYAVRKVHWFEKFNWFISSEGYLILSGRDAQQNELLVKRYLRKGDVYVHADIAGAASCIVRARDTTTPISPFALQEAGTFSVCRSKAWGAKIVTSAWWVWSDQVSKSAPSGEFLTTGSFMIYGKKNFLPPMSLEMGFAIMFRLDDNSVSRHLNDRKDRSSLAEDQSMFSEAVDRYGINLEGLQIKLGGGRGNDDDSDIYDDCDDIDIGSDYGEAESSVAASPAIEDSTSSEVELSSATTSAATSPEVDVNAVNETLSDVNLNGRNDNEDSNECDNKGESDNESDEGDIDDDEGANNLDESQNNDNMTNDKSQYDPRQGKDKVVNNNNKKKSDTSKSGENKKKELNNGKKKQDTNDTRDESQDKANSSASKKKKLSKKKQRRYEEQDDEDRELAMMALGHVSIAKKTAAAAVTATTKAMDIKQKQKKAGIHLISETWTDKAKDLSEEVIAEIRKLIELGIVTEAELSTIELNLLSTFPLAKAMEIIRLFSEGCQESPINNKSGFFSGIVRRFSKGNYSGNNAKGKNNGGNQKNNNKEEQQEIHAIMEEEGLFDEEEGKQADDVEKLTGCPLPEDTILYAIPVCGPYSTLKSYKYKVKLTPGTQKKGKAVKQAIDLFSKSRECSNLEKQLMKALSDPEMVAVMLGDVKLSMPGLQQLQKQIKKSK